MKKRKIKNKILAIAAHPDDLDFSSSGTFARFVEGGSEVFYLIISDGSKGVHKVKFGGKKLAKIRKEEQKKAAKVLGIKEVLFLGVKDGEVENTVSLRKKIVKVVRKIKPDILFGFEPANFSFDNPRRFHRDHRQAGEAVFDAVYPAAGSHSFFPELLKQGYRPHQIKEFWFFGSPKPNKFINIAGTIKKKIKALFCHDSQLIDKKETKQRIISWAKKAGKKRGFKYAESFRIVKFN